ncbi:hypothetical protein DRP07_00345 [Archaeoglobales archaeon]|nr:MAG: hypothetical protein DRP07_00345 [Archaeoglobales archaeon]
MQVFRAHRSVKDYVSRLYSQDIDNLHEFLATVTTENPGNDVVEIEAKYSILEDPTIPSEVLEYVEIGLAFDYSHSFIPSDLWDFVDDSEGKPKIIFDTLEELIRWYFCVICFNDIFYIYQNGMFIEDKGEIASFLKRALEKKGITRKRMVRSIEREILWRLKTKSMFREFPFNKLQTEFIPCKNGVLWRKERILLPHSPAFGYTYRLNVNYNPDADCPKIRKFLSEVTEDSSILYEIAASCLLQNPRYHHAYMLVGDGSNGKSTYLDMLTTFLGRENVSNISLQELCNDKFKAAELLGKLANIYADLPKKPIRNIGKFKMITGGDRFVVEKKFKDPFFMTNTARLIFSANELPEVNDATYAFWRRWIVVKFPNRFRPNPRLLEEITDEEELSGFLNEVLIYLAKIEEVGVKATDMIEKAMEEWMSRVNEVYAFAKEMLIQDPNSFESKDKIYAAYKKFCEENEYIPKAKNTFARELQRFVSVETERIRFEGKRIYVWKGIRLKEVSPEEVDYDLSDFDKHEDREMV